MATKLDTHVARLPNPSADLFDALGREVYLERMALAGADEERMVPWAMARTQLRDDCVGIARRGYAMTAMVGGAVGERIEPPHYAARAE